MLTAVTCGNCKKRYKVDSKLGGKKVKCKECGGAIAIPVSEEPKEVDLAEDLLAGLSAATADEQKAPARAPVAKPVKAAGVPAKGAARKPVAAAEGEGEMDLKDPPCPRCGVAMAPAARFCVQCGFNKDTGREVVAAAVPGAKRGVKVPANAGGEEAERDRDGVRINVPYSEPALNAIDTWGPKVAAYLITCVVLAPLAFVLYIAMTPLPGTTTNYRKVGVFAFEYVLYAGVTMALILGITTVGIQWGAKMMKCHLPEDRWSRLLATYVLPLICAMGVILMMAATRQTFSAGGVRLNPNNVWTAFFVALGLFFGTGFFTFLFFFRLKILEAVISYALLVAFFVVSLFADGVAVFMIKKVLVAAGMEEAKTGP